MEYIFGIKYFRGMYLGKMKNGNIKKFIFFNEKKVAENINSAIMLNECGEDMKKYVNVKTETSLYK